MKYKNLFDNIISIIKESQIKLGYDSIPIGINYVATSLEGILGTSNIVPALDEFCVECRDVLGEVAYRSIDNGYRLDVSTKGVDYVHSIISDDEFLVQFINTVRRFDCTIDDVINVFKSYGDDVVVKRVDNGEFDYLIYFEGGTPDAFWYCIDTEDLGMTYHRLLKNDYIELFE